MLGEERRLSGAKRKSKCTYRHTNEDEREKSAREASETKYQRQQLTHGTNERKASAHRNDLSSIYLRFFICSDRAVYRLPVLRDLAEEKRERRKSQKKKKNTTNQEETRKEN